MPDLGLPSSQQMIGLLVGFIPARAIYAAAKIGLADHVDAAGSTAEELAQRLRVDVRSLERLLHVLNGLGVLHIGEEGRFVLTELGQTLRAGSPSSIRDYALFVHEFLYELFGGLVGAVASGRPAVEAVWGAPLYTYLQENPDRATLFHSDLSNRGRIEARAILDAYNFADCHSVVDLGGGNGAFLSAILAECPNVSAMLVERPSAIEAARAGWGGLLPRCELIEGDFFQSVPSGGDVSMSSNAFWSITLTIRFCKSCETVYWLCRPINGFSSLNHLAVHLMSLASLASWTSPTFWLVPVVYALKKSTVHC